MGLIRIYERSSKPKRKPGWAQEQAEYEAWLKRVSSTTTNFSSRNRSKVVPKAKPVPAPAPAPVVLKKDFEAFKGGTVSVNRPELMYRDNPELLERELKARERKFNVAPAYNKGPTILVSEEEITNQLVGGRRR